MSDLPITNPTKFTARALLVGERIDLRSLEKSDRLASHPVALAVRGGGVAVLFRYGVVVLFDVAAMEEATFMNHLRPMIMKPHSLPESEDVGIEISTEAREGMEGNTVSLPEITIERLQLVADVLAKSVVLARYESKITGIFDRIEPLALNLGRSSKVGRYARALARQIGDTLISEQNMVGRAEVTDKPELLWEHPELERLYLRLEEEFEISERHSALERKLELISRTAHTSLELLQNRRSLRVEWYIVILILVEIIIMLYEMFRHG